MRIFPFNENKDTRFDNVWKEFKEQDLIHQYSRDVRVRLNKFLKETCMVPDDSNLL